MISLLMNFILFPLLLSCLFAHSDHRSRLTSLRLPFHPRKSTLQSSFSINFSISLFTYTTDISFDILKDQIFDFHLS